MYAWKNLLIHITLLIEDLTAQSKLNFKRYQSLLIINAQRERRNTIRPDLHPNLIPSFSTRVAQHTPAANKSESDSSSSLSNVSDGNRQKKKKKIKKRPLSAPPGGRLGSVKHTHSSLEKDGVKPTTISSSKRKTNITNSNYLAALNAASGEFYPDLKLREEIILRRIFRWEFEERRHA